MYTQYGSPDVLQFEEVEKPAPNDVRGVLIKIHAASAKPVDYHRMKGGLVCLFGEGLRKPKDPRLGTDIAGRVEAVAGNATQFKQGMRCLGHAQVVSPSMQLLVKTDWR